jgi:hypothetical protein
MIIKFEFEFYIYLYLHQQHLSIFHSNQFGSKVQVSRVPIHLNHDNLDRLSSWLLLNYPCEPLIPLIKDTFNF